MAGDLHTLIRIRKWEVDQRQRALAQLFAQEANVLKMLSDLDAEMAREKAWVSDADVSARVTYAEYLKRCDERRERILISLELVREQIEVARDELRGAYRRLKTFEISQDQRDQEEAREEDRKETEELDEIGLNLYRRKDSRLAF